MGGILGSCKQCSCPTIENSHSSSCILSQLALDGDAAVQGDEFVCNACEQGYEGNKCEMYGFTFKKLLSLFLAVLMVTLAMQLKELANHVRHLKI